MREGALPEALARRLEEEEACISELPYVSRSRLLSYAEALRRLLARCRKGGRHYG